MPTPFSHLRIADCLLNDPDLPDAVQELIHTDLPAFLLGSVAADARVAPDAGREATHFYRYDRPMDERPWRVMLRDNPTLWRPPTRAERAFVTAYVAHLAADEYWSRYMLGPHFANGDWGESLRDRFFVLHLLLIYMDERDLGRLPGRYPEQLKRAEPDDWLPFMPDHVLAEWRDFIAGQISGGSKTLEIFGQRVGRTPEELRALLDDPDVMRSRLWDHITPELLAGIEAGLYRYAREQMAIYVAEASG